MIRTENKPVEQIVESLGNSQNIYVLVCGGCPEGAETTTPEMLDKTTEAVAAAGKKILGRATVDFLCHKALTLSRLQAPEFNGAWRKADRILVFSCGIGVAAAAAAMGALPRPDSLENKPRLTPDWMVLLMMAPTKPPVAAVGEKAW